MSLAARAFLTLAITVFTVSPLLACCLTGFAETEAVAELVQDSPCHGDGAEPAKQTDTDSICPDCADCDPVMLKANGSDGLAGLLYRYTPEHPSLQGQYQPLVAAPDRQRATGPPRAPPLPVATPVSLSQRLLI